MKKEDQKKLIKYWQKTAEHDFETMEGLYKIKRYSDSLFFGHIVLEKILKGLVVKKTGEHAPYTHDLTRLYKLAELELNEKENKLLLETNEFNMRARYPEWKLNFYKLCTKEYTGEYIKNIIRLYKKLCQKLKLKK